MPRVAPPAVAVIGGGPAGLMAAETLAQAGAAVTVYDRMPSVGRRLLMAGRGGLNLTHSEGLPQFLARYGTAADRLRGVVTAFPPDRLRGWCEELGETTFVGSSGRVFPQSFKASPLLRAWLGRLESLGVRIVPRHRWTGWDREGRLLLSGPDGEVSLRPGATVLALGGASWPRLGSDGTWVGPLTSQGVAVAPLRPANSGFSLAWSDLFRTRFAGAPLKRIALAFDRRHVRGEAMVTATGIEGGAVYALSAALRDAIELSGEACLTVDLRPDLDLQALLRRLGGGRLGQSTTTGLRKAGLAPVAIGLLREAAGGALPGDPEALARLVKAAPLRLTGVAPIARAISTAGGVRLDEIDESMMLRRRPGVFVAGEMLDFEAPTGGYLLQAAFATGAAAGRGATSWLAREGA